LITSNSDSLSPELQRTAPAASSGESLRAPHAGWAFRCNGQMWVVHDPEIAEKWAKQGFTVVPVESLERAAAVPPPAPLGYVSASAISLVRGGGWGKLHGEPATIAKTPVFLVAPQPEKADEQTLRAVVDALETDDAGKQLAAAAVRAYLTALCSTSNASKE